ncbi:MAG: hypothetical protein GX270_06410 [Clostridiaceae bacterium]|nr:hypothetical protein [Clostridiaceae bacterium]
MRKLYYLPIYSDIREKIVEQCVNALENGNRFIYILPSKEAMFDVRERIIERHGGLVNHYIFGFDDLEREIVKDSIPASKTINESASILILRSLLRYLVGSRELLFFNKVYNKLGFIEVLYRIIKRIKRLNLTAENLETKIDNFNKITDNKILYNKCTDVLKVFRWYENYKKDKDIYDIDDISIKAVEMAKEAPIFANIEVLAVDGFINIDPINKELLVQVLRHYPDIRFIASIPFKNHIVDEFVLSEVVKDFIEMGFMEDKAYAGGYEVVEKKLLSVGANLFSQVSEIIDEAGNIKILNAPSVENEVRQVARLIKKMLISGQGKVEDFALYVNDMELYQDCMLKIFNEYGLPISIQPKQHLLEQPLVRDILSIIDKETPLKNIDLLKDFIESKYLIPSDAKKQNTEMEDVVKYAEALENEVVNNEIIEATAFNKLLALFEKVTQFRETLSQKDKVSQHVEAVLELIKDLDIRNNIISLYEEKAINSKMFIRDMRTLDKLINAFNGMKHIYISCGLEEDKLDFKYFLNSFLQIYSNETIDMVTSKATGVKVINPDLARGQYYDYVFILGINEGEFPAPSNKSIFDDFEDDILYENGINLYNYKWELQREKIRFNLACASARKGLYLSYRTSKEQGGFIIKSSFLENVEQLFTKATLKEITSEKVYMRDRFKYEEDDLMSESEVREAALSTIWQCKGKHLDKIKGFLPVINSVQSSRELSYINNSGKVDYARFSSETFNQYDGLIGKTPLRQLLNDYTYSAYQVNSYASCRLKYFFEKVLELGSFDEDEELNPKNEGTLYHEVLRQYYKENLEIETFDEERLKSIVTDALAEVKNTRISAVVFEARKREIYELLKQFLIQDIDYIKNYHKKTGKHIKPVYLEQFFEETNVFNGGKFKGFIDRLDLEVQEDGSYTGKFVMYDYKRRSIKSFKDCVTGEDYQLAVYYHSILNKFKRDYGIKNPECMALLYYSIEGAKRDGFVRTEYKKFLFSGNKGPRITMGMLNFEILMDWLKNRVENIVGEIKKGDFTLPYHCPSEHYQCRFKSICRFDKYRVVIKKRDCDEG